MSNEPMFSVSDIVRVKSVEQLVSEFGECIDVPSHFTTSMRQFCGNSYVIKDIHKRLDGMLLEFLPKTKPMPFDELKKNYPCTRGG